MAEKSEKHGATDMKMEIDRTQADTNNGSSAFLQAYLEGSIVSEADRRQVERIIAESNAAKRLRCHFRNSSVRKEAKAYHETFAHTRKLRKNDFADRPDPSTTRALGNTDELLKRFNALENFVLMPIELGNTKELAEEHLTVRIRSIEMLEEVLELIAV